MKTKAIISHPLPFESLRVARDTENAEKEHLDRINRILGLLLFKIYPTAILLILFIMAKNAFSFRVFAQDPPEVG